MKKLINNIGKQIVSIVLAVAMIASLAVPSTVTAMATPSVKHSVTLEQTSGGTAVFEGTNKIKTRFNEGDTVKIELVPDDGYQESGIEVIYNSDNEVAATDNTTGNTAYSFEMPNEAVTVDIEWSKLNDSSATLEVVSDSGAEETVSEDKESSSKSIDYFGDIKEVTDKVDVADEDVADAKSDVLLEQYIAENADADYIGEGDLMLANAILAKQTLFDGEYVKSNDTIDSIMSVIEQANVISDALLEDAYNKFMYQTESYVSVYATSIDADYYVALADVLIDNDNFTAREAVFAENNNNGVVLDGCIFDKETGLVYIPKDCFFEDKETYEIAGIQVQLMQIMKPGGDNVEITTEVTNGDELSSVYTTETTIYDTETQVYTETGLKESNMEVSVNGVVYEDDAYDYDSDTGLIKLNVAPTSVQTVSINIEETTVAQAVSNTLSTVWDTVTGTVTANAATNWESWDYFWNNEIRPGDLESGHSYDGTAGIQWVGGQTARSQDVYAPTDNDSSVASWNAFAKALFAGDSLTNITLVDMGDDETNWTTFNIYLNKGVTSTYNGKTIEPLYMQIYGFASITRALVLKCTHVANEAIGAVGGDPFYDDQNGWNYTPAVEGQIIETLPVRVHCYDMVTDNNGYGYAIVSIVTHYVNNQAGVGVIKVAVGPNYDTPEESTAYYEAREAQPQSMDLYINKEDIDTGEPLEGAEFEVYCDNELVDTVTTDSDGIACVHWDGDILYTGYRSSEVAYCSNYDAISPDDQKSYHSDSEKYQYRSQAYSKAKSNVLSALSEDLAKKQETTHTWKVVETQTPPGAYYIHEDYWEEDIAITTTSTEVTFSDEPYGWMELTKVSENPSIDEDDATDSHSCYSVEGAKYGIYASRSDAVNDSNRITTMTTDENGQWKTDIRTGTYYIKELEASPGYYLCDGTSEDGADSNGVHEVVVTRNETTEFTCKEPPMNDPLGITIYKIDRDTGKAVPQGNASLEGAEFTIKFYAGNYSEDETKSMEPTRTWVIKTIYDEVSETYRAELDDDYIVPGVSSELYYDDGFSTCPLGTYTIQETTAPTGYIIKGEFYDENDEYICDAGEVFYTQLLEDPSVEDGVWIHGGNIYTQAEEPARGDIDIAKWDYELVQFDYDHENWPQGDGTLAGATFEIINDSAESVVVPDIEYGGEEYDPGEVVIEITTEWDESRQRYIATTGRNGALPYGHYIIREKEDGQPVGYLHDGVLEREFDIEYDGQVVDYTDSENSILNNPIRGGFELQKRDAQTALAEPQGGASFEGIEVALVNESEWCVLVDVDGDGVISETEHFEPGDYIMSFYTDENGYIITDERLLPYGSYRLYEVNIPALDGYLYGSGDFIDSYPDYGNYETTHMDMLADANVVCDFKIRTDNKIVNLTGVDDEYGDTEVTLTPTNDKENSIYDTSEDPNYENMVAPGYAMEDLVKRGDIALRKQDGDTQSTPDGPIQWKLTSQETGETHYFWTDENGDYSSDSTWNPHTYKTNEGEDYTDGLWFYGYNTDVNGNEVAEIGTSDVGYDEEHLEVVDNSLGALPYGWYDLDELPGEYNQDKTLVHTSFEIYRDTRVVDLGTIDNYSHGLETTATNAENGRKYFDTNSHAVVSDAIEYWGLEAGGEYTFITMLYDLDTGDFVKGSTSGVNEPADSGPEDTEPGIVEPDEELSDTDEALDDDADIEDSDSSDALDAIEASMTDAEIEDGSDYVYDTTTFTATHRDGTKTVEFTFDATGLDGHTIVVYEYLFDANGDLVVAEEDPESDEQTLYFTLIGTELTADGGSHTAVADGNITLTDTVMYEGLPTNRDVTMSGTLYNKETGTAITTAETTWFNEESDGTLEIEFTFDASDFDGGAVVAGEEAYVNNALVGHHFDLDDEAQTVYFPYIGTSMTNNWTGEHQATVFENHNIDFTDIVSYNGLDTSKQYIVKGYLMDPETQEVVIDAYGLEVTSESEVFTPSEPNGEIEVHFDFFAYGLQDTYTVAFEYIYEVNDDDTGTLVAQHTDYDDVEQTVQLMKPTLWTDASITGTDNNQTDATDNVSVTDMLDITDLIIGHTYYVYGKAVHSDGTPVLDATTGEPVELYNMFVADATEMELDIMQFNFDATGLDGQSIVFEEYMYADEDRTILITEEEDLGAYEETIFFNSNDAPVIGTTLKDVVTNTHTAAVTDTVSLTDAVTYEGLTIGESYTVSGYLMDKETGEKLLDADGNEIYAESEAFVPDTPSGTVDVTFTFDASGLSGTHAVAFETLYGVDGSIIATHEDIDDEDQTVLLDNLAIGTTLLDEYTGSHDAFVSRNGETTVTLIDTIAYGGLTSGEEYSVKGTLMNRATGEALLDANGNTITTEATFTADGESGNTEATFTFDASGLAGITAVAYESLYDEDKETPIASHEDLTDENQMVLLNGPIVGTTAKESGTGSKTVLADNVSITDTVDYAGLVADEQYTLVGYAADPSSGDAVKDASGNIVTQTQTFTAGSTSGSEDVIFAFDASNLADQTIVFVEYLYYGDSTADADLIAWHFDLTDEAQSIKIESAGTTTTSTSPGEAQVVTTSTPAEVVSTTAAPTSKKTADMRYIWIIIAVAGCAAVAVTYVARRRIRVKR